MFVFVFDFPEQQKYERLVANDVALWPRCRWQPPVRRRRVSPVRCATSLGTPERCHVNSQSRAFTQSWILGNPCHQLWFQKHRIISYQSQRWSYHIILVVICNYQIHIAFIWSYWAFLCIWSYLIYIIHPSCPIIHCKFQARWPGSPSVMADMVAASLPQLSVHERQQVKIGRVWIFQMSIFNIESSKSSYLGL